ncbi:MAG: Hsp70 family protein, partial [Spirochaetales bacterium]|nr:Hsp70 family protein [Spirochaetales bacterium]
MAKIGIRLADGKFYPILEEGEAAKKRLIVTTVKDDQPSVQIDVYRASGGEVADAYVGSLIIENIPPRQSGEPDIRLDLGLDDEGNLSAYAQEEATGEHQALTVSLKSLAEEEKYEIPDFDFQDDASMDLSTDTLPEEAMPDLDVPGDDFDEAVSFGDESSSADESSSMDESSSIDDFSIDEEYAASEDYSMSDDTGSIDDLVGEEPESSSDDIPDFGEPAEAPTRERRKGSPLVIGLLAALGVAIILAAAFLIYTCTVDRQPEPPTATVQAPAPAPEPTPAPAPAPAPEPAKTEPPAPAPAPEPAKVETPAPAPAP